MITNSTGEYRVHKQSGQAGEIIYLTFLALDKFENLTHLFTTRHGGVSSGDCSSWNFGNRKTDTNENILRNFEILGDVINTSTSNMVLSQQTHTNNIKTVTRLDMGKGVIREQGYTDIDGLITNERKVPIITTHADCNSIYFYDPKKEVIALAHSGWKGTLLHIGREMVVRMKVDYGCNPADVVCGIGPALCQNCFEVDEDVAQKFFHENKDYEEYAYKKGIKSYIDLKQIIKYDLKQEGIITENINDMNLCTKCNNDMFFSHRGQGRGRGLMIALMMIK